ncbi:unnamed protein product, partial [Didymodactylos carnosus]
MKAARVLGIIFAKAKECTIQNGLTEILVSLTEAMRANAKETKFKLYLLQATGEIMVFIGIRDDFSIHHAACKIIENLFFISDKQSEKFATTEVALSLWTIYNTVANNEHMRSSALAALCHMGLSYGDVLQALVDKVTIKGDMFQTSTPKVLQYFVTLLAILAKKTKNRVLFIQDILPKMNILYENTHVLTRAKAYTLTNIILTTYNESIFILAEAKLFQAYERDVRRTFPEKDENDLIHDSLNRLTTLLSTLFGTVIDELLSGTEQTSARKPSPVKDSFKRLLPYFRVLSIVIGNSCIRSRIVNLTSIKKLFKLMTNVKMIAELNIELTKSSSSLTEIISCVSLTLDSLVRARELLNLFNEIIITDLLPLLNTYLSSTINDFIVLSLCVLNELLNELQTNDCVLTKNLQLNIRNELLQAFLIQVDRLLLKEEPIPVITLHFIQTLVNLEQIQCLDYIKKTKIIQNMFSLITQHKEKTIGALIQSTISCFNTMSEKANMIQIMIEN